MLSPESAVAAPFARKSPAVRDVGPMDVHTGIYVTTSRHGIPSAHAKDESKEGGEGRDGTRAVQWRLSHLVWMELQMQWCRLAEKMVTLKYVCRSRRTRELI